MVRYFGGQGSRIRAEARGTYNEQDPEPRASYYYSSTATSTPAALLAFNSPWKMLPRHVS